MKVTVVGAGYVGLTTGISLAYLGHHVTIIDKDEKRIELLVQGKCPIHEPGLETLLAESASRVAFGLSSSQVVGGSDVVLIAVGTPSKPNGQAETCYVEEAMHDVARGFSHGSTYTVVVKSTVPVGTNRRAAHVVQQVLKERSLDAKVHVASNPEFLREGMAVHDTLYPDRIVVGATDFAAFDILRRLYRPILEQTFEPPDFLPRPPGYNPPPMVTTDPASAEMIKYAANAFLAMKISFINEIAGLCEKAGADVTEIARGIGLDPRIGQGFLKAGLGWGGSCFPKDTAALLAMGREFAYRMPMVEAAREVNWRQRELMVDKLQAALKVLRGRVIGLLGLAFKPNTDDLRDAPAVDIIRILLERGAIVRVHDPVALPNAKSALVGLDVAFVEEPYRVAEGADALLLATEWDEYRRLDLKRLANSMATPILIDGRNALDAEEAKKAGFTYMGVGR